MAGSTASIRSHAGQANTIQLRPQEIRERNDMEIFIVIFKKD
jgi:hypothetical protein